MYVIDYTPFLAWVFHLDNLSSSFPFPFDFVLRAVDATLQQSRVFHTVLVHALAVPRADVAATMSALPVIISALQLIDYVASPNSMHTLCVASVGWLLFIR